MLPGQLTDGQRRIAPSRAKAAAQVERRRLRQRSPAAAASTPAAEGSGTCTPMEEPYASSAAQSDAVRAGAGPPVQDLPKLPASSAKSLPLIVPSMVKSP